MGYETEHRARLWALPVARSPLSHFRIGSSFPAEQDGHVVVPSAYAYHVSAPEWGCWCDWTGAFAFAVVGASGALGSKHGCCGQHASWRVVPAERQKNKEARWG